MKSPLLARVSALALVAVACGRTDAGITTALKSKLVADDTVKARQISVDTKDHVVTLTGEVRTQAEKDKAEQIARSTDGVRDVVDQIAVVPAVPQASLPPDNLGSPTAAGPAPTQEYPRR
jgi:hypothetical protein